MVSPAKTLALTILGREYRVNCPDGAEEQLRDAADFLNERMQEIQKSASASGKDLAPERIAVIAALNVVHQFRESESQSQMNQQSLRQMHRLLDESLAQDQQMEL